MPLTKVTKSGITNNAIDADKLEDGTILAADITPGTITAEKLNSTLDLSSKTVTLPNTSVTNAMLAGSIANAKLANSSLTINGSSVSLGSSISAGALDWQAVITADGSTGTTGVAGRGYFINTTSAAHTFTLPSSPTIGDTIAIVDYAGTFATNKLTIARNGNNIQGVANNSQIGTNRASVTLVYVDATKGWVYQNESNVADLQESTFISATGGTVATSGNFKIHTFTGDGCFVVSAVGNPSGGGDNVDYLVVAGGGSGGKGRSGGAGAGGFRVSNSLGLPAPTMSPLSSPTGITVTATTFPITVGAGGAGATSPPGVGNSGSNSVFSTITSTGGGGGGADGGQAGAGGSGGGGGESSVGSLRGLGNSPPTSPPQGNNGGLSQYAPPTGGPHPESPQPYAGGGGGGAGAAGGNSNLSPGNNGGPGGVGSFLSPSFAVGCAGTPGPAPGVRYFAGGGAGMGCAANNPGSPVPGGAGGGANAPGPCTATAGTANTGGGGSSHGGIYTPGPSGAGGKGIVIIRYKFQ